MADDKEQTIMVPTGDFAELGDNADAPDTEDQLAHELATIQKSEKRIAIIGSRNLAITHQQVIETLAFALASQGNTIITSGGSSGTNSASICKSHHCTVWMLYNVWYAN